MPDLFLQGPVLPPYEHPAEAMATICNDRLTICNKGTCVVEYSELGVQRFRSCAACCTLELVTLMMIKETSERHGLR